MSPGPWRLDAGAVVDNCGYIVATFTLEEDGPALAAAREMADIFRAMVAHGSAALAEFSEIRGIVERLGPEEEDKP